MLDRAETVVLPVLDRLRGTVAAGPERPAEQLKADGTPITATDTIVDQQLTEAIGSAFPDHGVISEEAATSAPRTAWTWVLDPVDGTANLTAGLPWWCVSVALCLEGRPVWAVVDAPALDTRYVARAGQGASQDGRILRLCEPVDRRASGARHVPLLVTAGVLRRATGHSGLNPRVLGSVALDVCQVASGRAAGAISPRPHVWDVAAAQLVVEQAGGALISLGETEPLLPLRSGVDYRDLTCPVAAGPGAAWLEELAAEMGL